MDDKFKMSDSYRFSTESDALRTKESERKLVRETENKLVAKLNKLYGASKLVGDSAINLKVVAEPTSKVELFDGSIKVQAKVFDKRGLKQVTIEIPVKANSTEIDEDVLKDLVDKAEILDPKTELEIETEKVADLEVDLSKFILEDDGSDFLCISHPAMDTGKGIGVIGKNEYGSLKNKEEMFKKVFENQILGSNLENHFAVKFVGNYTEPTVAKVEISVPDFEKEAYIKKEAQKEEPKVEETQNDLPRARMADSYTQAIESEKQVIQSKLEKLETRVINDLSAHLKNLKYSNVKIGAVDSSNLEYSDEGKFDGEIKLSTSLIDPIGSKLLSIPLKIERNNYRMPKKETVVELLANMVTQEQKVQTELDTEVAERNAAIDELEEHNKKLTEEALLDKKEETEIKKEASNQGGQQQFGPFDTMQLPKHMLNLPEDVEVGYELFADGCWWKLTSKSSCKLSKGEDDGSIYTFTKILPKDEKPETELTR